MTNPSRCPPQRAVSTVVDVTLALLLISVALVLSLSLLPAEHQTTTDERSFAVETLTATTLNMTYSVAPAVDSVDDDHIIQSDETETGYPYQVYDGSAARALRMAAIGNSTGIDSHSLDTDKHGKSFLSTLEAKLHSMEFHTSASVTVHATWEPFKGADLFGTATVGDSPPENVETSLSHLTVPSGFADATPKATEAIETASTEEEAFEGVARSIATVTVDGLLQPEATQRQLASDGVDRNVAVARIYQLAVSLEELEPTNSAIQDTLSSNSMHLNGTETPQSITERFVDALTKQFTTKLIAKFNDPEKAVAAISTADVTISVTEWGQ